MQNRSIPSATLIPELGYADVCAAATWLCDTFGFAERLRIADHRIQLTLGAGALVVIEGPNEPDPAHASTHVMRLRVENIDAMFEIGRRKKNRATELVFVERCLVLLRPGGRMAIVLPDGNLNNPSLSWLRRWSEGKARIDAVVSLPEETFVSSRATVKASILFLTRFTDADTARWDAAWADAHLALDAGFDEERDEALSRANALGPRRPAAWERGDPPAYPRGIGATRFVNPLWGKPDKKKGDEFWTAAKAAIREIDRRHDAAL